MKYIPLAVLAVVAVVFGGLFYLTPKTIVVENPVGVASGPSFDNLIEARAGIINQGIVATSSQASAQTLTGAELKNWANAGLVSYTPQLAAVTVTLPASSTMTSFLARPGDRQSFCVFNATSTAGTVITFAGGVGTNLLVASSSVSALGSKVIVTGKAGCFTFYREAATSTAYDIQGLFTAYN